MRRVWPHSVLGAMVAAAAVGAGCGEDRTVTRDEAVSALEKLPFEVRYRAVPTPSGLDAVIAGRVTDRAGIEVDFAVLLGRDALTSTQLPVVPYAGTGSEVGLGDAYVIASSPEGYLEPHSRTKRREEIARAIEEAIFAQEPDQPRGG